MPKAVCAHEGCKKKLTLTDFPCKCQKKFCSTHRPCEEHACSYDFKAAGKEELLKFMSTPVIAEKLAVI